jgi:ribosomal protein S27AE
MTRHLNPSRLIKLERPFTIFIEPGDVDDDGNVEWFAKLVGPTLDQMTFADSAIGAVDSALDVLRLLTGTCPSDIDGVHNWIVDHGDRWECGRCGEIARKESIVDE